MGSSYARIRVRINIKQPLKKHIRVYVTQVEEEIIILLSYERLPDFCYNCGCIGHSFRDCEIPIAERGKLSYGSWLKVLSRAGGVKLRPSSPPNKSHGNSESHQTSSPLRYKDDLVANSTHRDLVLNQEMGKTTLGEKKSIDRNRELSIELDSSNDSVHGNR